ncbi:heat shock factor 2-binding protein-like isoform X2 [Hetaerina americana]|uniref:heat shock factor 2-binding protein-like isoform X2 n=1 Tax=Hetaerina americana TaxID=62018 RepID=UPI003A7F52E3
MAAGAKTECQHSNDCKIMNEEINVFDRVSETLTTITRNLSFISKCVSNNLPLNDLENEINQLTAETQSVKNGVLDISDIYLPYVQNGSTLACMLWRACREPEVVNSMLAWYKFPEFLRIATGTLESFTNTYIIDSNEISIPAAGSEEGHFVAGMVGTVANMSAAHSGREILLSSEHGQQLMSCMVEALASIPAPDGDYLRRLLLMALYNVVIEDVGLNFLLKLGGLPVAIGRNILSQGEECLALSLHILALCTSAIPSSAVKGISKNIPREDLKRIAKAESGENCLLAMEILQNLKRSA